jgi:predicted AAA+ superfamily ATPase
MAEAESKSYLESDRVKQTIISTHIDDFSKYGKRVKHQLLQTAFRTLPRIAGERLKYTHISRDYRPDEIARALHRLALARIWYPLKSTGFFGRSIDGKDIPGIRA